MIQPKAKPGPPKLYHSYLPQVPCTELERLDLSLLAHRKGTSPTEQMRQAWEAWKALPENAAELLAAKQPTQP